MTLAVMVAHLRRSAPCHEGIRPLRRSTADRFESIDAVCPSLFASGLALRSLPYCRGEQPTALLKAVLDALSESEPSDRAMTEMGSLEFTSLSPS